MTLHWDIWISLSHLKIPGARKMTWTKFCTENPQILGITIQNSVSQVTSHPRFMDPVVTICVLWSSCTDSEWPCKWWLCSETAGVWSQAQTFTRHHKWLQSLSSLITHYKCHFYCLWRQVTLKCSVNMRYVLAQGFWTILTVQPIVPKY